MLDVEALSYLCKALYGSEETLDVVSLHVGVLDILRHALAFVENYDCETVGDPQTAVAHFGDVVLFIQFTLARFNVSPPAHSGSFLRRAHTPAWVARWGFGVGKGEECDG